MLGKAVNLFVFVAILAALLAPRTSLAQRHDPRRDTMAKLAKPLTVDFTDARLEDVFDFLETVSLIDLDVMWIDDQHTEGLDKDEEVSVAAQNVSTLSIIERVLDKAQSDFEPNTWQMGDAGQLEVGPKSRLNRFKRLEMYDIQDLLFRVNNYSTVPELDLDAAIQQGGQGGGGGGGGSIFEDNEDDNIEQPTQEEQAQQIIDLIVEFVEPEQWRDNGGDGGTITYYREGVLLVRAADYIHRQLGGYSYWPARLARSASARVAEYDRAYARAQRAVEEERARAAEAAEAARASEPADENSGDAETPGEPDPE